MKTILRTIRLALALATITLPAHAATNAWRGGIFSTAWSERNNWDPAIVPQDGDMLIFPASPLGTSGLMVNDLTNLIVSALMFDGGQAIYELQGNTLIISRGIFLTDHNVEDVRIQCGLVLAQNIALRVSYYSSGDLHISGPIELNGQTLTASPEQGASVTLSGVISGSGSLALGPGSPTFGFGTVKLSGSGANTFSGQIRLSSVRSDGGWVAFRDHMIGANLELDKNSGPAVPGPLSIDLNSHVTLKQAHQIADSSAVSIRGGGGLKLEGNTETIGSLDLTGESNGVWAYGYKETLVDTGGATLSVEGNITSSHGFTNNMPVIKGQLGLPPGSHIINVSGTRPTGLDIQADIIGGGGFTKTGPAGLLLSGDSSFAGDAVLQEGTTYLYHANALGGPSGAAILDGGTLSVVGAAIGAKTLWVNRPTSGFGNPPTHAVLSVLDASWAGPVVLNTNLFVHGGPMTFSGAISGPGDLYLFGFTNRLTGPEGNTYTGVTTVDCHLLELDKPSGLTAFRGPLVVGNRSTISPREVRWLRDYQCVGANVTLHFDGLINLYGHREDFGPITFNGGEISTGIGSGFGELGLYGPVTVNPDTSTALISGRLGLPPGLHEFRVADGAAFPDLRIDATMFGAGSLRKTGPGQLWLAASNSYEGLTTVAEGALSVLDPFGLGAAAAGTTVDGGATLELNFAGTAMPEPLALRGTGIAGNGALGVFGNVTLRNPFPSIYAAIDLTTDTTIGVAPNSRLTVDGFISGTGPLRKAGRGTLVLANINPNTYSGDTFVAEGVLNLSKPNFALSVPGNLMVGPAPLNSSAIARWSTSGGMNPSAIATINAGSLLDLNGNSQPLLRLNLNDGGDAQTGGGVLSFPLGGTVAVGSLGQFGSHAGSSLSGSLGLQANGTLAFAVNAYAPTAPFDFNPELDVSATIPAPAENPAFERAGIAKSGPGTMRLFGNTSFDGRVEVMEGTLIAASSLALGSPLDGTFVLNHAKLALEGDLNVEGEILVLNSTAAPALENLSGENYWSGPVIMQRHSSVGARASSLLQLAGVISGTANFTQVGPGTLRFGGGDHNTYGGETFINEGTFLMSKPSGITAVPGPLSIGTSAGAPATAANLTSYQVIGNIFVNRNGLLNLNGQSENVDHLWLSEGGDVQTTTGVLFLKTGGSIQVVPGAVADSSIVAGNLDMDAGAHVINVGSRTGAASGPELEIAALMTSSLGAISLQKNGSGTLRLAADNTYGGSTRVNAGTLQVDGSQPGSSVSVFNGARLMGIGRVGGVEFVSIGGAPGIVAPGRSPGVLSCLNFNPGGVGGTLRIELNGLIPGIAGHDQLYARSPLGIVSLENVTLDASLNFVSAVNDQFRIIRKDGFQPLTGEFNGLPEGTNFYISGEQFTITYAGGDGNDVVLTRIPTPTRPALTIEHVAPSFVRVLWPASFNDYTLQSTTNLSLANWTAALPLPVATGTNNVVTNATSPGSKFYRLFKP